MQAPTLHREVVGHFWKDSSKRVYLTALTVLQEEYSHGDVYVSRQEWDVDYSKKFGYLFHNSGFGGKDTIEVSGIYHASATCIARKLLGEPVGELRTPTIIEKEPQWVGRNARETKVIRKRNRTCRIFKLPKAIDLSDGEDLLDWLQSNGIESDSVWCSTCKDFFPGSNDYDLCEHVWWCDKTGDHSTPNERCDCKSRDECREED